MLSYPPEKLWPIYEKLPKELQEAIFSEQTAGSISDICTRNGIKDDKVSQIAKYTGYVLLGVLSPSKFQETLEKEASLSPEQTEKVSLEISRFIFLPIKESLHVLYSEEIISPKEKPEAVSETAPSSKRQKRADTYREPIE